MADFEGLKEHIALILRELDQVQGSMEVLRKNEFEGTKERAECISELKRMAERLDNISAILHAKIDNVNEKLSGAVQDNKKLLTYILAGIAGGYGIVKALGLDSIIGNKLGQ